MNIGVQLVLRSIWRVIYVRCLLIKRLWFNTTRKICHSTPDDLLESTMAILLRVERANIVFDTFYCLTRFQWTENWWTRDHKPIQDDAEAKVILKCSDNDWKCANQRMCKIARCHFIIYEL